MMIRKYVACICSMYFLLIWRNPSSTNRSLINNNAMNEILLKYSDIQDTTF